jgi:16S rRNA (cytosine1402-N4)-methyltransferase
MHFSFHFFNSGESTVQLMEPCDQEEWDTMAMPEASHEPVMLKEVLSLLNPRVGGVVVDATLGLGGHAASIAAKIGPKGRLVAIDKDEEALAIAQERLRPYAKSCLFVHDDFRNIDKILERLGVDDIDAAFFDCGVSSYQLDHAARGFSLKNEGPLDMRMDRKSFISAYDLVNNLTEEEIASILWKFGEERFSRRVARAIAHVRARAPIASTRELADIVTGALPPKMRRFKIHPATRTFQALRIAVNRELDALEEALKKTALFLRPGGRIGVIAFHSLEDRIVKNVFRDLVKTGRFDFVFKKILRPADEEVMHNPRSRSARLRMIERRS